MLKIGLLKEIRNAETRVALVPDDVESLVGKNIEIYVEAGAGEACGFDDKDYLEAGARMLPSAIKIFKETELIVKVQSPMPEEIELLTEKHTVISFFNVDQSSNRFSSIQQSKASFLALEYIEDNNGEHPVLAAMSEISGKMAIHVCAYLLSTEKKGKGIMLSGTDIVKPAQVSIIGSGLIGRVAAVQAWKNGANVALFSLREINEEIKGLNRDGLNVVDFSKENLDEILPETDVLLISVFSLKHEKPKINITKDQIALLKKGSIVMDLSIEQNSIVETSHLTNLNQPVFESDGIIYYCVPNIEASVPVTSSSVLSRKILHYVDLVAHNGLKKSLEISPELLSSILLYKGKVTNRVISDRFNEKFYNIFDLFELKL